MLGFAAVNTGNNLLFLIVAALLGFMAVSGIMGWLNIQGLFLGLEVPDEIYSGRETLLTIRLRNSKRKFPSFLLSATAYGLTTRFTLLDKGGEETNSFVHTFHGRGRQELPSWTVCSPFPVNFFVRCVWGKVDKQVLVFPAPIATPLPGDAAGNAWSGEIFLGSGYEGDLAKIGDYSGREPVKLIHWKLSAKHDRFKVKQLHTTVQEPVMIDVAVLPGSGMEEKLSFAAYLVNRLVREDCPVGLKLGEKRIPPALSRTHRLRLLAELALYD